MSTPKFIEITVRDEKNAPTKILIRTKLIQSVFVDDNGATAIDTKIKRIPWLLVEESYQQIASLLGICAVTPKATFVDTPADWVCPTCNVHKAHHNGVLQACKRRYADINNEWVEVGEPPAQQAHPKTIQHDLEPAANLDETQMPEYLKAPLDALAAEHKELAESMKDPICGSNNCGHPLSDHEPISKVCRRAPSGVHCKCSGFETKG